MMGILAASARRIDRGISSRAGAMFLMLSAAIIVSFSGLIVRNIEAANPWQINLYRNLAFFLIIIMIILGRYGNRAGNVIARINAATIAAAFCLGIAGVAIVQAYAYTSVANTVFYISATPLFTLGLAYIFLGERLNRASLIAMMLAVLGLALTAVGSLGTFGTYGNVMALVTALGLSGFTVIVRANRQQEMLPALALAGLIVVIVSFLVTRDNLIIAARDLALCILWGAVLSGAAQWAFIQSANQLNAGELTMFNLFETALGPLWVWIFMNEVPGTLVLAGGVIVVAAVGGRLVLEPKLLYRQT